MFLLTNNDILKMVEADCDIKEYVSLAEQSEMGAWRTRTRYLERREGERDTGRQRDAGQGEWTGQI